MRLRLAVLILLAPALSCADLADLRPGACGNGVREGDEACDTYVDPELGIGVACGPAGLAARACRLVCDGEARCPTGWGCGADDVCRKPTGRFELVHTTPLASESLTVADVDGDGRADLIGADRGGIEIGFQDGEGRFDHVLRRPAGHGDPGAPAVAPIGQEEKVTIALAVPNGLVFLRDGGDRVLGAAAFPTFPLLDNEGAWAVPLRARPEDDEDALLFLYDERTTDLVMAAVVRLPFQGKAAFAAAGRFSLRNVAAIPTGDLDGDGAQEAIVAVAGTRSLYRVGVGPSDALRIEERVVGTGDDVIDALAPVLADLDSDGALEVLVPVSGRVWIDRTVGGSGFDERFDGLENDVGRAPLAAGDLGWPPDGVTDFVLPGGLYESDGDALVERHPFEPPLSEAVLEDFDGDGSLDIAAIAAGEEHLRIHFSGDGLTPLVVALGASARSLRAGDFDGRGPADVAYVSPLADGLDGLSVIFDFSGSARSEFVGAFPPVERLETGSLQLVAPVPRDGATDLFLTHASTPEESREGTVVLGSGSRVLDAPLPLQRNNILDQAHSVIFGRLRPGEPAEAIALSRSTESSQWRWWRVSLGHAASAPACAELPCSGAAELGGILPGSVEPPRAVWMTGDVDGDDLHEVIGISREGVAEPEIVELDLSPSVIPPGSAFLKTTLPIERGVTLAALADLDGDGAADLVTAEGERLRVRWAPGFEERSDTHLPSGARSVVPIHAAADDRPRVAVLCDEGIAMFALQDGRRLERRPGSIAAPPGHILVAGDVTRDDVEDLLVAGDGEVHVLAAVTEGGPR